MIVDPVPSFRRIASEVWKPLTVLFIWDCAVTVTYYLLPFKAPELPLTIFGSALALFLGFRSNSAYQRWWEARTLWGAMINASRNIARATRNFMPDPDAAELKREIVKRQIAYVNALRCQLRRQPIGDDVTKFLTEEDKGKALARTNPANGLLDSTGRRIDIGRRNGWLDTIQQMQMELQPPPQPQQPQQQRDRKAVALSWAGRHGADQEHAAARAISLSAYHLHPHLLHRPAHRPR